ncbi:hypothetical protein H311_00123 [Anncaliia algerae PRA109]|nr:hypothetical protein H311_00123 [Anncaliia algerae PRA109]
MKIKKVKLKNDQILVRNPTIFMIVSIADFDSGFLPNNGRSLFFRENRLLERKTKRKRSKKVVSYAWKGLTIDPRTNRFKDRIAVSSFGNLYVFHLIPINGTGLQRYKMIFDEAENFYESLIAEGL